MYGQHYCTTPLASKTASLYVSGVQPQVTYFKKISVDAVANLKQLSRLGALTLMISMLVVGQWLRKPRQPGNFYFWVSFTWGVWMHAYMRTVFTCMGMQRCSVHPWAGGLIAVNLDTADARTQPLLPICNLCGYGCMAPNAPAWMSHCQQRLHVMQPLLTSLQDLVHMGSMHPCPMWTRPWKEVSNGRFHIPPNTSFLQVV